jgi:hypothetical protein
MTCCARKARDAVRAAIAAAKLFDPEDPWGDPSIQPEKRDEPWPGPDIALARRRRETLLPAYYPRPTEDRGAAIARQTESIEGHLFAAEMLVEARREIRRRRDAAIAGAAATKAAASDEEGNGLSPAEKGEITKRVHREVAQQFGYGDRLPLAPQQLNTGAQGTGKTATAIKAISTTPTSSTFLFTEPTLDKAAEVMADYQRSATEESPAARLLLGRSRDDPMRRGHYMCDRHEAANRVAQAGLSVGKAMCATCKERKVCGHNRQKREVASAVAQGKGVVAFGAAAYAPALRPAWPGSPDCR